MAHPTISVIEVKQAVTPPRDPRNNTLFFFYKDDRFVCSSDACRTSPTYRYADQRWWLVLTVDCKPTDLLFALIYHTALLANAAVGSGTNISHIINICVVNDSSVLQIVKVY